MHALGHRRPRLDQGSIDGEVLVAEQILTARLLDHRIEELAGGVLAHQPRAQARKVRLVQAAFVQAHVQEPAEQDVVVEHLAKHPVRAYRVQRDQQTPFEQPLRRDRRPASIRIKTVELAVHRPKHRVRVTLQPAQRMFGRNARFRREVREHRRLRIYLTAHRVAPDRPAPYINVRPALPMTRSASSC